MRIPTSDGIHQQTSDLYANLGEENKHQAEDDTLNRHQNLQEWVRPRPCGVTHKR